MRQVQLIIDVKNKYNRVEQFVDHEFSSLLSFSEDAYMG